MTSNNDPVRILYIVGNGRSGSTILNVILGQLDGHFAGGELRRIWDRGLIANRLCGCGRPFRDCPTWNQVFDEAFGGMDQVDPHAMVAYRERFTQTKHLVGMVLRGERVLDADRRDYLSHLVRLYRAIRTVTGCQVIADASKWPMYAFMLDQSPSLELYFVHLVRDPRALAFSWAKKKYHEPGILLLRQGPVRSTFYWLVWNPAISHFWDRPDSHYYYLPYSRFATEPKTVVAELARFAGSDGARLPFLDATTVELVRTHAVAGNAARLTTGPVAIRPDEAWRSQMSPLNRLLVSAMSWPLRNRYAGGNGRAT